MGVIIIEIQNSDDFTKTQTQLKGGITVLENRSVEST